jgi:uncharacterized protein (TIGR03083 family)
MDLPQNKPDLLDRIQREWAALLAAIDAVSAEQMNEPDAGGWSIKDNLAHLTEWERFLIKNQFEGQAAPAAMNIEAAALKQLDEAGINAVLLQRNQSRPLPEVLADLHQTHARLLAALDKVSFLELQTPTQSTGPRVEPVLMWVFYNTYDHYAEHRQTITRHAQQ